MKRLVSLILLPLLLLCGCDKSMNWVISSEPSVCGVVEAVGEETVTIRVTSSDDPAVAAGTLLTAEKATRLQDCKFSMAVGDEVQIYYDGGTPVDPLATPAVRNVHGYCLIAPVRRDG